MLGDICILVYRCFLVIIDAEKRHGFGVLLSVNMIGAAIWKDLSSNT
jgi:hypothetical protein